MMIRTASRRSFLRYGGATVIALPFLRARYAKAAGKIKRLVIYATPNGAVMQYGGTGGNQWFPGADGVYPKSIKPFESFKAKSIIMRGLDMKSALVSPVPRDHLPDFANLLTARQPTSDYRMTGPSIDQHIADKIGSQTAISSLVLGVQRSNTTNDVISSRGSNAGIAPQRSPTQAFDQVFKGVMGGDPLGLEKLRGARRTVVDAVHQDLKSIRCELGMEERAKFDLHVESVQELQKSLDFMGGGGGSCNPPAAPMTGNYQADTKAQLDIIVAALACDRTRVVTVVLANTTFTWLGQNTNSHTVAHNSPASTKISTLGPSEEWYGQQFAYLLNKLNAIDEGGSTMLDNSAVVWGHEQSEGGSHKRTDMPFALVGSCGGFFKGGQNFNFMGRAHNDFLISLANAMDVPTTTFGNPSFVKGPITELQA